MDGADRNSPAEPWLHIVLHQPEIPQNTGNIGRTCVALGAKLWLVRPLAFRLDESRLKRAGLDYWDHLNWEAVDSWTELADKIAGRLWLFTKSANTDFGTIQFQRGDAFVFGGETKGLPQTLLAAHSDSAIAIPMKGPVRSLNLASCVAVAGYEALRQCRDSPN